MLSLSWFSESDGATGRSARTRTGARGRAVRRWVGRHRRPLAALLLATAAGVGFQAVTAPPPVGVEVAVAAADLPAGHLVAAGDVRVARLPADAAPTGVAPASELVGQRLSGAVREGEPLTDRRMATEGPAAALGTGRVAMPVDLRAGATRWLTPGARVSLLASRSDAVEVGGNDESGPAPAHLVARDVVVLDVPAPDDEGLLATADVDGARTVLLSVSGEEAATLASVASGWWLSPIVLP